MYPFLTLDDNTEIVHSEMRPDGTVKVYLERPDAELGFRHATCYLPSYTWEDVEGFTQVEINRYQEVIACARVRPTLTPRKFGSPKLASAICATTTPASPSAPCGTS